MIYLKKKKIIETIHSEIQHYKILRKGQILNI